MPDLRDFRLCACDREDEVCSARLPVQVEVHCATATSAGPAPSSGDGGPAEATARSREADAGEAPPDVDGQVAAWHPAPERRRSAPSDRAGRRKTLEACYTAAHKVAASRAAAPLCHGRCCLLGLLTLEAIRLLAWGQGSVPGYVLFGIHCLVSVSDFVCLLSASPFYAVGTTSRCVRNGCVGPMVTLVFSMTLVDVGALCTYLVIATPRPLASEARSRMDVAEACVGSWAFMLLASAALQLALLASSWRVYKELRLAGLYPPGKQPLGIGKIDQVRLLEVVCEADDARYFAEFECIVAGTSAVEGEGILPAGQCAAISASPMEGNTVVPEGTLL